MYKSIALRALVLSSVVLASGSLLAASQPEPLKMDCVVPYSGMTIATPSGQPGMKVVLCPGEYALPAAAGKAAITIHGKAIEVKCAGTVLDGGASSATSLSAGKAPSEGTAFHIEKSALVTLAGCTVRNYDTGVLVEESAQIRVEDNMLSDLSYEEISLPPGSPVSCGECMANWNNINRPFEQSGGGAILIRSTMGTQILRNRVARSGVGVEAFDSTYLTVEGNRMVELTDFGVRLSDVDDSVVYNNSISAVSKWQDRAGCVVDCAMDSAGILLVNDSDGNTIDHNEILDTYGASGFFIGNDWCPTSDDNIVSNNRIEGGGAGNAIEATFASGNVIDHNLAAGYPTGMWPTYSTGYTITNNIVRDNTLRQGIALVNVREATVTGNRVERNPVGILVRSESVLSLPDLNPNTADLVLRGNAVTESTVDALRFEAWWLPERPPVFTTDVSATANLLAGDGASTTGVRLLPDSLGPESAPDSVLIAGNSIDIWSFGYAVRNEQVRDIAMAKTWWSSLSVARIESRICDGEDPECAGMGDVTVTTIAKHPLLLPKMPSEEGIGNVAPLPPFFDVAP